MIIQYLNLLPLAFAFFYGLPTFLEQDVDKLNAFHMTVQNTVTTSESIPPSDIISSIEFLVTLNMLNDFVLYDSKHVPTTNIIINTITNLMKIPVPLIFLFFALYIHYTLSKQQ